MDKRIMQAHRKRLIEGSFGWIDHRFIREGYIKALSGAEILLYFFLAVVSDQNGISFYGPDRVMTLLKVNEADYFQALAGLEAKDHICRQGNKIQLLSLPPATPGASALDQKRHGQLMSLADILREAADGQR